MEKEATNKWGCVSKISWQVSNRAQASTCQPSSPLFTGVVYPRRYSWLLPEWAKQARTHAAGALTWQSIPCSQGLILLNGNNGLQISNENQMQHMLQDAGIALEKMLFVKNRECYSSRFSAMGNLVAFQGTHSNIGSLPTLRRIDQSNLLFKVWGSFFLLSPSENVRNFGLQWLTIMLQWSPLLKSNY